MGCMDRDDLITHLSNEDDHKRELSIINEDYLVNSLSIKKVLKHLKKFKKQGIYKHVSYYETNGPNGLPIVTAIRSPERCFKKFNYEFWTFVSVIVGVIVSDKMDLLLQIKNVIIKYVVF